MLTMVNISLFLILFAVLLFFAAVVSQIVINEKRVFPEFRKNLKKGDKAALAEGCRALYVTPDPEDETRVLVSVRLNALYPTKEE